MQKEILCISPPPKRKNGSAVVRLVECFREKGKVKTRIVKTIGQSKGPEIIEYYKKQPLNSFRINKHTLKMRPMYHRLSRRIRSPILLCFLAYTVLRYAEIELKKAGLFFSPQELIDVLKGVESFIIRDTVKKQGGELYCVPRELSPSALQIYKAFKKKCPTRPYLLN